MKTYNIRSIHGLLTGWLVAAALVLAACSHWTEPESIYGDRGRSLRLAKSKMDHFMGSVRYQQADAGDHYRLGRYFQQRGRHMLAVDEFSRAIQLDPRRADAHNAMGVSYDQLRQFDRAVQCYRRAQILKPDFAAAYNNLGYSYLMQARPEKAVDPLEKAVSLQDRNARFNNNLELAYRQVGRVDADEKQPAPVITATFRAAPVQQSPQIEIANGNGVGNMAKNIGNFLKYKGFEIQRLSNADHFGYPRTRIFYSDGQRQTASALSLLLFGPDMPCDLISDGQHGQIKILMGGDAAGLNDLFSGRMKIQVANGNGARDMAGKLSSHLRTKGFYVVKPVNAGHFGYGSTQIHYPAGRLANARFVARELPEGDTGRLIEDDRRSDTIYIIIGKELTL
jgi:hypothetical protein